MTVQRQDSPRSYRAERDFGLLVGGVISLFCGWKIYHGNHTPVVTSLLVLGLVLILAGALAPRLLVHPNRAWMKLAVLLSAVTTPLILGIIYYLVVMPIGVGKRLMGWDPLRRRSPSSQSYWTPYNKRQQDHRHFERMF